MKGYDVYALAHLVPIAVLTGGAGRAMTTLSPTVSWIMFGLCAISTLMTVEVLAGWPVITTYSDRTWRRRQRREGLGG